MRVLIILTASASIAILASILYWRWLAFRVSADLLIEEAEELLDQ